MTCFELFVNCLALWSKLALFMFGSVNVRVVYLTFSSLNVVDVAEVALMVVSL